MALTKRLTKNSPISAAEHDGNIRHIERLGFADLQALLVNTATDYAAGEIVRAGAYDYVVLPTSGLITTAGGVNLNPLPSAAGFAIDQIGTSVANMQALLTYADSLGVSAYIDGPVTLNSALFTKPTGIRGSGGNQGQTQTRITATAPLRAGWSGDTIAAKGTHHGGNAHWRDLTIHSNDPANPTAINNEAHNQIIDHCSFRGTKNTGVPHLKLGATLYNRITNCDFGNGDGIHAKESDWDVAYYGLNASWIDRSIFNQTGTAMHLHGIFSVRDCDIENSASIAPKMIIGEDGGSSLKGCLLDFIYFEGRSASSEAVPHPYVRLDVDQAPIIVNCVFDCGVAGQHPAADQTVGIKSVNYQTELSIRNNYFSFGALDVAAIDVVSTSNSYHEYVGNRWSTSRAHFYKHNGVVLHTKASDTKAAAYRQRVYVRDRHHGELKQAMPERNIWLTYTGSQVNDIRAEGGKHHVITATPSVDIVVSDAADWKGARFTIHFEVAVTLKHGAGFFRLAKGADAAIPAGTVLDFVIDRSANVREVGTATRGM